MVRRIKRGQNDSEIARAMGLDRGTVGDVRKRRTGLTAAQVRDIADGL